jgi:hypothetical protein
MKLAAIQHFDMAVALIRRGMRLSIVSRVTSIHLKQLRSLHREIHGRGPTAGQMPSTQSILATRSAQATASVLAALYRSTVGSGIYDQIDMTAHNLYRELLEVVVPPTSPVRLLDITQAWVIARDLRTGAVSFQECRPCHIRFLSAGDAPPERLVVVTAVGRASGRAARGNRERHGARRRNAGCRRGVKEPMNSPICPPLLTSAPPPCPVNQAGAGCIVERCDYLESIHLIRLGARIGLPGQLTGLGKKPLKRIYRQRMGKPAAGGQLPFSDNWFLQNDRRLFHLNLIWYLHRRLNRPDYTPARRLIDIFEVYTQLAQAPMLDLNRTAFAIQLFTTGLWTERHCSYCETPFPAPMENNQTTCPGCRLYFRYRCRHCNAPLSPKSRRVQRI